MLQIVTPEDTVPRSANQLYYSAMFGSEHIALTLKRMRG
jgi:hypothetical protein